MTTSPTNGPRTRRGFTLLELVLVMVLICVALAITAPSLRGFRAGADIRNSAARVVALMQMVRAHAISESTRYTLTLDNDAFKVTSDDINAQPVDAAVAIPSLLTFPDGMHVELQKTDPAPTVSTGMLNTSDVGGNSALPTPASNAPNTIEFYPDGRCEPGRLKVYSQQDSSPLWVICLSPTERWHVATSNEVTNP